MLFLAGADDVFSIFMTLVFGFIAFMGWIGQFMKNKQQGAKRAPQQRPRDGQVQNEIERFLQEVTGQRQPERPRPQAQQAQPRATEASPPPRRPPQRSQQQSSQQHSSQRREAEKKTAKQRRTAQKSQAGSRTQAASANEYTAQQAIPPRVTAPSHYDQRRDVVTTLGTSLAQEFRDPAAIRKAIVLNMILGRPKALESRASEKATD